MWETDLSGDFGLSLPNQNSWEKGEGEEKITDTYIVYSYNNIQNGMTINVHFMIISENTIQVSDLKIIIIYSCMDIIFNFYRLFF